MSFLEQYYFFLCFKDQVAQFFYGVGGCVNDIVSQSTKKLEYVTKSSESLFHHSMFDRDVPQGFFYLVHGAARVGVSVVMETSSITLSSQWLLCC